jgi:hypothetical protein
MRSHAAALSVNARSRRSPRSANRRSSKQIHTPQTVLRAAEDGQPRRPRGLSLRLVPSRQNLYRSRYLRSGLAALLAFTALKMAVSQWVQVNAEVSVAIIAEVLFTTTAASVRSERRRDPAAARRGDRPQGGAMCAIRTCSGSSRGSYRPTRNSHVRQSRQGAAPQSSSYSAASASCSVLPDCLATRTVFGAAEAATAMRPDSPDPT